MSLIDNKINKKTERLAQIKAKIEKDVEKKYRIRSKYYKFRISKVENQYGPISD